MNVINSVNTYELAYCHHVLYTLLLCYCCMHNFFDFGFG